MVRQPATACDKCREGASKRALGIIAVFWGVRAGPGDQLVPQPSSVDAVSPTSGEPCPAVALAVALAAP